MSSQMLLSYALTLLLLPVLYLYVCNYAKALQIKVHRRVAMAIALLYLVLLYCVAMYCHPRYLEKVAFLYSSLLLAYFLYKRYGTHPYPQILSTVVILNCFHLIATCLGDYLGYLMIYYTKNVWYTYSAYPIQFVVCLMIWFILGHPFIKRSFATLFLTKGGQRLALAASISLNVIWSLFFMYYYEMFALAQTQGGSLLPIINVLKNLLLVIAGLLLLVAIVVILIRYIQLKNEKLNSVKTLLLQQQTYIQMLEGLQNDVKTFRHDYKNILLGVYSQAKEGDMEGVQKFIGERMLSFERNIHANLSQLTSLNRIQVIEVKSLVMTKVLALQAHHIPVAVEVLHPVTTFRMDIEDAIRCIGILFDNAMEQVMTQERPSVSFVLYQEDHLLTLIVKNSTEAKPNLQQLNELGYSTKGQDRGIGLYSYHRILSKYGHVMCQTEVSETWFQQTMRIKLKTGERVQHVSNLANLPLR